MKIAIPTNNGRLSAHFGHCEQFAIVEADVDKKIVATNYLAPPAHEPGALPKWLRDHEVDTIIAGGMGTRAQQLFTQFGIEVVVGTADGSPQELAQSLFDGSLQVGDNVCDH